MGQDVMMMTPPPPHTHTFTLPYTCTTTAGIHLHSLTLAVTLRGAHGHVVGSRPWCWAENNIEELMANIVGKREPPCLDIFFYICFR